MSLYELDVSLEHLDLSAIEFLFQRMLFARLDWFLDNKDLLISICNCFKPFYQRVGCRGGNFCADVTEFSKSTGSIEVESFLNFCLKFANNTYTQWNTKVCYVSPLAVYTLFLITISFLE